MSVNINWKTVDDIDDCGHGVEIFYLGDNQQTNKLRLAFIVGFKWMKGYSDKVVVEILLPESNEFTERGLDGSEILSMLKKRLTEYLQRREVPIKNIGGEFITVINS